jgi:NTP pyrophosphatase (non-canonical NTP hydrolase)
MINSLEKQITRLNEYQLAAIKTIRGSISGASETERMMYLALKLNGEAGEVADKIGKVFRDDAGDFSKKRQDLILELGDVLWYVAVLANELHIDLADVAQHNITKLADRNARNKIGGEGDYR